MSEANLTKKPEAERLFYRPMDEDTRRFMELTKDHDSALLAPPFDRSKLTPEERAADRELVRKVIAESGVIYKGLPKAD